MTNLLGSLICVIAIGLAGMAVGPAVAIPIAYAAFAIFLLGLSWRVIRWSLSPVPFRIPTVCGQQKSLPWIKLEPARKP